VVSSQIRKNILGESRAGDASKTNPEPIPPHRRVNLARKLMNLNDEFLGHRSSLAELVMFAEVKFTLQHPLFKQCASILILIYAVLLGVDIEKSSKYALVLDIVFGFFFYIELLLRICSLRLTSFLYGYESAWNIYDLLVLVLNLVNLCISVTAACDGGMFRQISMLCRVAYVVRVLRFWPSLQRMLSLILSSISAMKWVFVMACFMVYLAAVFLTDGVLDSLSGTSVDIGTRQILEEHFGTVVQTACTLYLSITHAPHWKLCSDALFKAEPFLAIVYLVFVLVFSLSILNILIGVILDCVLSRSSVQRDSSKAQEQARTEEVCCKILEALCSAREEEGGDEITLDELLNAAEDAHVFEMFKVLGIHGGDSRKVFRVLGESCNGVITARDVIDGCSKLRNGGRHADVPMMIFEAEVENKRQFTEIKKLVADVITHVGGFMHMSPSKTSPRTHLGFSKFTPRPDVSPPRFTPREAQDDLFVHLPASSPISGVNQILRASVAEVPFDTHDVPWSRPLPSVGVGTPRRLGLGKEAT